MSRVIYYLFPPSILIFILFLAIPDSSEAYINILNSSKALLLDSNCRGGIFYDSAGTYQNAYSLNCGYGWGRFVMKLTPIFYPYTINRVCIALSRTSAGGPAFAFNIDFFDTSGSNGSPGNLIYSIPVVATPVPILPSIIYFNFSNLPGIPSLNSGSYYVGINYNPCVSRYQYIGAVESGTLQRPGYIYIQGAWQTIQNVFPNYKVLGIRAEQVPVGIIKNSNEVPNEFKLYNNYPNPFNPITNIKYQIAKSSEVKLIVSDILGREVETLVNENLQPGSYEVEWYGNNYSSGVYFYQLISDGIIIDTKKMVLMK